MVLMRILSAFLILKMSVQQNLLEDGIVSFVNDARTQYEQQTRNLSKLQTVYDVIIVGAGIAGCVLANRLTENPEWNVLLLEAGDNENLLMDIPVMANFLQFSAINWNFMTMANDRYCLGMDGKQCKWPRGKGMGGSSLLNFMIYTRGNRLDYDKWAQLGNTGWSFDEVLPYFIKVENFSIPKIPDDTYHGREGYLTISSVPYRTKLARAIVAANQQMNIPLVDPNGPLQAGVSYIQGAIKDGRRLSANRAYLMPIVSRGNLHIQKMSVVQKILIDSTTQQAYGVEVLQNGRVVKVNASKEVILSAGAINSPQLLMLSGVGPGKHLQELQIPVIRDLPVGYNLMDHIGLGGLIFIADENVTVSVANVVDVNAVKAYVTRRKGPLTMAGGCEAHTFFDHSDPTNKAAYPNVEITYTAGSFASDRGLSKLFGIRSDIYDAVYMNISHLNTFLILPILLRPKSKGRLMLASKQFETKPKIFPNYFDDETDMRTLIKAVGVLLNITRQPALAKLGVRLHDVPLKECQQFALPSEEYFVCLARHFSFTAYHPAGTCRMAPASDGKAVVDPRLRVHGIKALRVIDASIIPEMISGHIAAAIYMIAEKGADMIKEDWKRSS